jgi:hypothetical protein
MPEVRQEIIIATVVVLSAMITFIGIQAWYPSPKKSSFQPKKANLTKALPSTRPEKTRLAPHISNLEEGKHGGKILEK